MQQRRGVLTAGSWVIDYNKTLPYWPAEDTMNTIIELDRQGGGSACNMAIDLKRLDPTLPVETMGILGDDEGGRFLVGQCDAYGIARNNLRLFPNEVTAFTDCFNARTSGKRTHIYFPGIAGKLSPDHFDFSKTGARILHLGLPGAHAIMDAPWGAESTGWAAVLKSARAAGLTTNLEMVSTTPDRILVFGRSCLPHLDLLIVNDYEIGAVAQMKTRDGEKTLYDQVAGALQAATRMGPTQVVVAHFPEGAIAVTRDGQTVSFGSVAMPTELIAGVNGAGDAFAAGFLYSWHEGRPLEEALRLGHACASASMRAVSTTAGVVTVDECLEFARKWGFRPDPAVERWQSQRIT
jgi:sugar/nucleoside kinase (ribokinase family)